MSVEAGAGPADWVNDGPGSGAAAAGACVDDGRRAAGVPDPAVAVSAAGAGGGAAGRWVVVVVAVVAEGAAGLVTVPFSEKFWSCEGPTVSSVRAGAAVTSIGASAFCARAGETMRIAAPAKAPFNAFLVMRRIAVIPPPLGSGEYDAKAGRPGLHAAPPAFGVQIAPRQAFTP
jgi:hypothetical protein